MISLLLRLLIKITSILCYDPKSVLATVGVRGPVDYTVVHGNVTVKQGRLATIDEEKTARDAQAVCDKYLNM